MDSEGLDLDTVGLLAAVTSNPSLIVAKPFDFLPFIPGSNVKGFNRKVEKVLSKCQGTLAVGVTGSSASTPNAEAVVDAASGPPAKKNEDRRWTDRICASTTQTFMP
jgi:CRISPR/Cas system CSM-associated protein Csm3 (group 7 of RAMP superfamily)